MKEMWWSKARRQAASALIACVRQQRDSVKAVQDRTIEGNDSRDGTVAARHSRLASSDLLIGVPGNGALPETNIESHSGD